MTSLRVRSGLQLLQLGRSREAYASFRAALDEDPNLLAAAWGCVRAASQVGRFDVARSCLERILRADPAHAEARLEMTALDARAGDQSALSALANAATTGDARQHLLYAEVLTGLGQALAAKKQVEMVGRMESRNPEVLLELGRLALARGDGTAAISHFHDAGELLPDDGFPKLLEARALAVSGHLPSALQVMTRAHQLAPREPIVYRELFQLCLMAENPSGAVRAARELASLEPASGEPLYLEGLALLLASDAAGAEAKLNAALAKDPALWEAKQALAKLALLRQQRPEAQRLLEAVTAERPTEPGPANDLASLLLAQPTNLARVEKLLRPVIAEHPLDAATAFNLALALRERAPAEARTLALVAAASPGALAAEATRLLAALATAAQGRT